MMCQFFNAGLVPFGDYNEYLSAQKEVKEFLNEKGLQDLILRPLRPL